GATVVIVGRDAVKTARVVDEIKATTGNNAISSLLADLSIQADIHRLATEFQDTHDRLDVLINNAGGIFLERKLSADGIEMTFALNHLNYFLLTNLLLDMLKASAPARVVNVASDAHRFGPLDFGDLQSERSYSAFGVYGRSKLANILFTVELAQRLAGSGVTVNALHPGFVNSGFGKNNRNGFWRGLFVKLYDWIGPLIARSPEKAAETVVYLATSPDVANVTGQYFVDCKPKAPDAAATDRATAKRLWEVSAELVDLPTAVSP
ncbi:MAG: SDR family NAD(P)-dependent oxidoreductase, partial [Caldilineaceae bacterium]|nr:SDR family NAD(P)-dependent oxidoreductase [Caldilineaceae bacterium]